MMIEQSELQKEKNMPPSAEATNGVNNHVNDREPEDRKQSSLESESADTENLVNENPVSENHEVAEQPKQKEQSTDETHDNISFLNEKLDKLFSLKESQSFTDFWFYVKEINTL